MTLAQTAPKEDLELALTKEKQRASQIVSESLQQGLDDGIAPDALAHASLFHALTLFVDLFGEDAVSHMMENVKNSVKEGSYTLPEVVH